MKRALSLAIAVIIILTLTAGCQNDNNTVQGTQTNDEATQSGGTASVEETVPDPDLPDVTYDGYEFKIYQRGPNAD